MDEAREQETIEYILTFSTYQEPLHILIAALLEKNLFGDDRDFSGLMLRLLKDGYAQVERQSEDGYEWLIVETLTEGDLIDYIAERVKEEFRVYPEEEYYVRTTKRGLELLRKAQKE